MNILLRRATLIDGKSPEPIPGASVLVEGAEITAVMTDETLQPPEGTHVVDLNGHWLLPGLIDLHVHTYHTELVSHPGPDAYGALVAARMVRENVMAGITTVRDTGSPNRVSLSLKRAVEEGIIPGSRVIQCGLIICQTGGHGSQLPASTREADGEADIRRAVREEWKAGADFIKVTVNGAANVVELTLEELAALVDEAHRLNLKVACHASILGAARNAALAGVDSIEHGCHIDSAVAEMMAEKGIVLVPTAVAYRTLLENAERFPPEYNEVTKMRWATHRHSVELALETGVKIGAGTDVVLPYHTLAPLPDELEILVSWGLTPMQAIQSATAVAAEAIGMLDCLGTIEPGKLADIIALEGDPLADISALQNVSFVIQGGKVVKGPRA